MKPTKLVISNIGKIASETIDIDKPLILFYGEIKQGKTTILNSVRWVCGGEFPDDIIRHGEREGLIELHFDGGMISRSFYRAKDGSTKARPVTFIKNGKPVASPVAEIKRLLNPFLLDQDFLRNKNELERRQYFTELFSVDTSTLDTEFFNCQRDAQALRSKISGYGEIDLTPVETVDASALRSELDTIRLNHQNQIDQWEKSCRVIDAKHATAMATYTAANAEIQRHNATVDRGIESVAEDKRTVEALKSQLAELESKIIKSEKWLAANPARKAVDMPVRAANPPQPRGPTVEPLESKIQEAGAINVRAEQYQKSVSRAQAKKIDEDKLWELERRQKEIKTEKQRQLKSIGESCGIAGLEFDETGNFIYDGTTAGMISDSQIMRLSSELSALYPDGFGLDLIDRAESLGKSIFEFVDKAKTENKSILATIVGERPAKVPADVGVFVVDDGKLS